MNISEKKEKLHALLQKPMQQLWSLSHQFAFQRHFEVELRTITRGKAFRIRNLDLWNALVNARDGLAVHTVSWATSMYEAGGFFGTISSLGLAEALALGSARDGQSKEKWQQDWLHGKRLELFKRVFPNVRRTANGYRPTSGDVTHLRDRFASRFKPLDADRNRYRAHAFEKQSSIGSVRRIHSPGRAQALKYAQRTLRWLSVLCTRSDYHFPSVDEPEPGDVHAQDLVDLMLDSTISFAVGEWNKEPGDHLWQRRTAYYERLHREHDARGAQRRVLFNDRFMPTGERV